MSQIERTTQKQRRWRSWIGTVAELRRIGSIIESLCEARKVAFLNSFDEETRELLANLENEMDRTYEERVRARQREEIGQSLKTLVTITDGDDKTSGPASEVLDELDRRTVNSVKFSIQKKAIKLYGEEITVTVTRSEYSWRSGAFLEVQSADQGWGRQAFSLLSEELDKGVPRWAWVHASFGKVALFAIAWVSLLVGTYLCLSPIWHMKLDKATFALVLWVMFTTPAYLALFLVGHKVRTWIFPQFELLGETGGVSQVRRLTFMTSILIPIPVGVLVNLMT